MVPPSPENDKKDEIMWCGLSYATIVCCMIPPIVIFFLKKDQSEAIKYHSLQAIAFSLAALVLSIGLTILEAIPVIGLLVVLVHVVIGLGLLGYWAYLTIQAFRGEDIEIPVVSDFIRSNLM